MRRTLKKITVKREAASKVDESPKGISKTRKNSQVAFLCSNIKKKDRGVFALRAVFADGSQLWEGDKMNLGGRLQDLGPGLLEPGEPLVKLLQGRTKISFCGEIKITSGKHLTKNIQMPAT